MAEAREKMVTILTDSFVGSVLSAKHGNDWCVVSVIRIIYFGDKKNVEL